MLQWNDFVVNQTYLLFTSLNKYFSASQIPCWICWEPFSTSISLCPLVKMETSSSVWDRLGLDAFPDKGERRQISKAERVNPLTSSNYAAANQPGCAPDQVNLGCFLCSRKRSFWKLYLLQPSNYCCPFCALFILHSFRWVQRYPG